MLLTTGKILVTALFLWAVVCLVGWQMSAQRKVVNYQVKANPLPKDDAALIAWLHKQPEATDVAVVRDGRNLSLRFVSDSAGIAVPTPPWLELGYEIAPGLRFTVTTGRKRGFGFFDVHSEMWRPLALLLCVAVGSAVVLASTQRPDSTSAPAE
jgi:hypothetical protein